MEWQQIVGFYHAARLRSFTKAGEATFRTQSALSQQIKALESELGCLLFERIGKRRLQLTPAGEKFFRFAELVLTAYDGLKDELGELMGLAKGQLTIAAPSLPSTTFSPRRSKSTPASSRRSSSPCLIATRTR